MRDRRKKAAEVIDATRMDMAGIEGTLKLISESKGDVKEIQEMIHAQMLILKNLSQCSTISLHLPLGLTYKTRLKL